jgi:MFS transporter, FSR family, fosmidomycin resistance protein
MSSAQSGAAGASARGRGLLSSTVLVLLAVEFLDEVTFGVREAAWPLVRDDLGLSYWQVGVVLSVPPLVGSIIESFYFVLADVWRRRALALAGGVAFAAAALLTGLSHGFAALLAAMLLFNPAAGLFVGLSQAALMDEEPARREQNMARWALAGSLGNSAGPLLVAAVAALALSWRWLFAGLAVLAVATLALAWRLPYPTPAAPPEGAGPAGASFRATARAYAGALRDGARALRRREVLRWLVLLQFGDFTSDLLLGFLALYLVDVGGAGAGEAALAVAVWTWAGLAGDWLMIPLLKRVRSLSYLLASRVCVLVLFPAFLLAEGFAAKVALLALLGLANAGWYAILKARLYAEMPGRSGTVLTLANVFGLAGSLAPLALGAFAERRGIGAMMWLLASGPAALIVGLLTAPRAAKGMEVEEDGFA